MAKLLHIVGTKGIPARYGGFETFAEHLALYLVTKGWEVVVYCEGPDITDVQTSEWNGVKLVHVPVGKRSPAATIAYEYRSTRMAVASGGLVLTLGYGTAVFNIFHLLKGSRNIINMDGIEWRRDKWGALAKTWLYLNERVALWTATELIADHPEIERYLARKARRPLTMIPYGAHAVEDDDGELPWGLESGRYALVIARAEPENSILDIVSGYSRRQRGMPLVILGNYQPETNAFHRAVVNAASDEVHFPGAVYDAAIVNRLRRRCRLYIHGHRVGGTNPSLVEAMSARSAVLAHDNAFNRWVVEDGAVYFRDADHCDQLLGELLANPRQLAEMSEAAFKRFSSTFHWETILNHYERLLERHLD